MKKSCFVSVIIPAYHSDKVIGGCLASLRSQTFQHFQVIVVNSSRECRTFEVVMDVFPAALFIQSRERLLPQDAKAFGIDQADGDLLAFIDPDCRAHPDWLSILFNRCNYGKVFVGGSLENYYHTWLECGIHLCKFHDVLTGAKDGPMKIVPFSNACLKREVWEEVGPFKAGLYGSDGLFGIQAGKQGYKPWFEPSAVVEHIHGLSIIAFVAERFSRGREFGPERALLEKWPPWFLLAMSILAPLSVVQVLVRSAMNAARSGKLGQFFWTFPLQLSGQSAWISGEALGYLSILRDKSLRVWKQK